MQTHVHHAGLWRTTRAHRRGSSMLTENVHPIDLPKNVVYGTNGDRRDLVVLLFLRTNVTCASCCPVSVWRRNLGLGCFPGAQVRTALLCTASCTAMQQCVLVLASTAALKLFQHQDGRLGRGLDAISRGVCAEADVDAQLQRHGTSPKQFQSI